jgi:hypothetical protein
MEETIQNMERRLAQLEHLYNELKTTVEESERNKKCKITKTILPSLQPTTKLMQETTWNLYYSAYVDFIIKNKRLPDQSIDSECLLAIWYKTYYNNEHALNADQKTAFKYVVGIAKGFELSGSDILDYLIADIDTVDMVKPVEIRIPQQHQQQHQLKVES